MIELDPIPWVPVTSALALASWLLVLYRIRAQVRHSELLPEAVREGSLVAVLAACVGGTPLHPDTRRTHTAHTHNRALTMSKGLFGRRHEGWLPVSLLSAHV